MRFDETFCETLRDSSGRCTHLFDGEVHTLTGCFSMPATSIRRIFRNIFSVFSLITWAGTRSSIERVANGELPMESTESTGTFQIIEMKSIFKLIASRLVPQSVHWMRGSQNTPIYERLSRVSEENFSFLLKCRR